MHLGKALLPLALVALAGCAGPANPVTDLEVAAWTQWEDRAAERAVVVGVEEMIAYLGGSPERVRSLGGDAVECLVDASYAPTAAQGEMAERARRYAAKNLSMLIEPWIGSADRKITQESAPDDFGELIAYTNYAAELFGPEHPSTLALIARTNEAVALVGDLDRVYGFEVDAILRADPPPIDELYDLVLWSISFTDAQTVPGLDLPGGATDLLPRLWPVLARYPWPRADDFPERADDYTFYDTAYLATHVGYIPTGYGRHPLRPEDAPWLLAFLRDNFDAVLEMGELDLFAEFVDLLRQFGFDESDPQVLRGSRYLMQLYHDAGGSWIEHREPYEADDVSEYDLLHKPWTAVSGMRARAPRPGPYAEIFQRATR